MPQLAIVEADAEYDSGTERRKLSRALTSDVTPEIGIGQGFYFTLGVVSPFAFPRVKLWMDSPLKSKVRGVAGKKKRRQL